MGKVLYTAFNQSGIQESGFIDVNSNKEAVSKLKERGLEDISLHGDAALGFERGELNWLSAWEIKQVAKFEARLQKGGGFFSYFLNVMKSSSITIAIGAAMVYYGYTESSAMWISSGVILATVFPFFGLWSYNLVNSHDNLMRAVAFGEWDEVEGLSLRLREGTKDEDVIIEADTMKAAFYAQKKDMDSAIKMLLPHRDYLDAQSPGVFENKLASLYHIVGEYETYLQKMRESFSKSNQDLMRVDFAIAEARFGSLEVAQKEIEKVDLEAMAVYALPIVSYVIGLIAYKKGDLEVAKEEFLSAYSGVLEYDQNPAIWTVIAMITGMLAMVMYDTKEEEKAEELLSEAIIKILNVHADKYLLEEFQKRFPNYF